MENPLHEAHEQIERLEEGPESRIKAVITVMILVVTMLTTVAGVGSFSSRLLGRSFLANASTFVSSAFFAAARISVSVGTLRSFFSGSVTISRHFSVAQSRRAAISRGRFRGPNVSA